jgi:hypothetical protein
MWHSSAGVVPVADLKKKAQHRAIDAKRRNLETEAMHVLQQLVMGTPVAPVPASSTAPVPKVSLLHACADYIRHLQARVQQQQQLQHLNQDTRHTSTSTPASVVERKRQRLDAHDGKQAAGLRGWGCKQRPLTSRSVCSFW